MIHWPFCKSLKAYYKRDFKPYIVADMLKSYITFRFPFLKDEPMSKELPLTLIPITYEANSPSQEWSFVQFLSLPWLYHFLLLCYGNEVCERTWSPLFALIFRTERHTVPAGTRTADLLVAALHQPSSPHTAKVLKPIDLLIICFFALMLERIFFCHVIHRCASRDSNCWPLGCCTAPALLSSYG